MKALFAGLTALVCLTAYGSTGITFYHNDLLGSPVMATDEQAQVLWRASYQPYGESIQGVDVQISSLANPIGYTGHVEDPKTSLVYMQARYYDPMLGRFLSVDPLPFRAVRPSSFNRYAYAYNNPYRYLDPDGEEALDINLGVIGFTLGNDPRSGSPFYKYRLGIVGLGVIYSPHEPFSHVDIRVGRYDGFNKKAISQIYKGQLGFSLGVGIFGVDANVIETEHATVEIVDSEGTSTFDVQTGSAYLSLGEMKFSSTGKLGDKNVGDLDDKIGAQLRFDLYYEYGETF